MQKQGLVSIVLGFFSTALAGSCPKLSVQAPPGQGEGRQENLFPGDPPHDVFAGNLFDHRAETGFRACGLMEKPRASGSRD